MKLCGWRDRNYRWEQCRKVEIENENENKNTSHVAHKHAYHTDTVTIWLYGIRETRGSNDRAIVVTCIEIAIRCDALDLFGGNDPWNLCMHITAVLCVYVCIISVPWRTRTGPWSSACVGLMLINFIRFPSAPPTARQNFTVLYCSGLARCQTLSLIAYQIWSDCHWPGTHLCLLIS
jgi:hypothetical protein